VEVEKGSGKGKKKRKISKLAGKHQTAGGEEKEKPVASVQSRQGHKNLRARTRKMTKERKIGTTPKD